jgi:hypothetical protein
MIMNTVNRLLTLGLSASLLVLSACGTDSGKTNTENRDDSTSAPTGPLIYTGDPAGNTDTKQFQDNLWGVLLDAPHTCRNCHTQEDSNTAFLNTDDINLAYQAVLPLINRDDSSASKIVDKVAGGHECWLPDNQACGTAMTQYIDDWLNGSDSSNAEVLLTAPDARAPGASKIAPLDASLYQTTIYTPVVREYCVDCHTSNATNAQSPYFADNNLATAYAAAGSKINISAPERSQFVTKLKNERHNCWTDCSQAANEMLEAINAFVDGIEVSGVDPTLTVNSDAITLTEGIVASSGGRHDSNVIALYQFKQGDGDTAYDTSGVSPALNLSLSGDYQWVTGWGVRFGSSTPAGKAQGDSNNSKLYDRITAAGEYAIEAWVAPANVVQGGAEEETARIISYSGSSSVRNFTLGQHLYNYDFLNRNSATDSTVNGTPALATADADERLQATLQHVVVTYSELEGRKIYVNGAFTGDEDALGGGNLGNWASNYALVMGAETSRDYAWSGIIKFAAIHDKALNAEQILQNFEVGVGEKFFLMFGVAEHTGIAESYVVFEVSEFDDYSYLFNAPFFYIIGSNGGTQSVSFDDIAIKGLRIGINGKEAPVGQAFKNLDYTITDDNYGVAEKGQLPLSRLGTVIQREKDKKVGTDEFFLSFELLGSASNAIVEASPEVPPPNYDETTEQADIGLKTFEEINASMAALSGISMYGSSDKAIAIKTLFNTVKQQLPTIESAESFLSSQQMAITQLAIKYCDALVEDEDKRDAFFPDLNFGLAPDSAFSDKNALITPLLKTFLGEDLNNIQPDDSDVTSRISALIDQLNTCPDNCNQARTAAITKASCAAILGSATTLLQ